MRCNGEWSLVVDDGRCELTRRWRALLAPYLALLALTIVYYPLSAWLLAHRTTTTSSLTLAVVVSVPIIAMVSWVPRLATERSRVVMEIDASRFTIERTSIDRERLLEVVLLPQRSLAGLRHRVFITYTAGDFANMIALAAERDVEAARATAIRLADWLGVPLSAGTSPPPVATLVRR